MDGKEESTPNYMTWDEYRRQIRYIETDIRNIRKAIKLIMGVLVDKKIVGEQTAKAFSETCPKEVLDWFLKKEELKEE